MEARPTWNNEMLEELARYTGALVNKWCDNETDLEECIEDAMQVLEYRSLDDGYELAKKFEDKGYNSDRELVEDLDIVSYERSNILNRHIEKWVKDNDLSLDIEIGTIVTYAPDHRPVLTGEIVKHFPERNCYGFWHDQLGYEKGVGSLIVNAEQVSPSVTISETI